MNKRVIRDKAPSKYMAQFARHNDEITATMQTHLIDMDKAGVLEDDFEAFLIARSKRFSRELKKRIIPQPIDDFKQALGADISDESLVVQN